MSNQNYQNKPFQTPEESLHWISFNLKNLVKELKEINAKLTPSVPEPQNERRYHQQDIPF